MTNVELLPKQLVETLNSRVDESDVGMLLESITYKDENVLLTFSIRFHENKEMDQLWQVNICGIEVEHIIRSWTQHIEIFSNHIQLLEYHDIQTELYFNGTTNNTQTLFIDIIKLLLLRYGKMTDVAIYMLAPEYIQRLSKQSYGLFARGSKSILELYAECLTSQGIKSTFIGEYDQMLLISL